MANASTVVSCSDPSLYSGVGSSDSISGVDSPVTVSGVGTSAFVSDVGSQLDVSSSAGVGGSEPSSPVSESGPSNLSEVGSSQPSSGTGSTPGDSGVPGGEGGSNTPKGRTDVIEASFHRMPALINQRDPSVRSKSDMARSFAREGRELTPELANQIIFDGAPLITLAHIQACRDVCAAKVTLPMPTTGSPASKTLNALAGNSIPGSSSQVPLCYHIESPTGDYVGQTRNGGTRSRDHASGRDSVTGSWLGGVVKEARITLYRLVPGAYPSLVGDTPPAGLTLAEMLCLLELYLFIKLRPVKNIYYYPIPGVLSPEMQEASSEVKRIFLYVYKAASSLEGGLELLHVHKGVRSLAKALGAESPTLITKLLDQSEGWYYSTLLFSRTLLTAQQAPSMTLEELKAAFAEATRVRSHLPHKLGGHTRGSGFPVTGVHAVTGEKRIFDNRDDAISGLELTRFTYDQARKTGKPTRSGWLITRGAKRVWSSTSQKAPGKGKTPLFNSRRAVPTPSMHLPAKRDA